MRGWMGEGRSETGVGENTAGWRLTETLTSIVAAALSVKMVTSKGGGAMARGGGKVGESAAETFELAAGAAGAASADCMESTKAWSFWSRSDAT